MIHVDQKEGIVMPCVGAFAENVTETEHRQARQSQLREIFEDAAENVLERPNSRRGPYVIADSELRSPQFGSNR